jgi:hypothetical protein
MFAIRDDRTVAAFSVVTKRDRDRNGTGEGGDA